MVSHDTICRTVQKKEYRWNFEFTKDNLYPHTLLGKLFGVYYEYVQENFWMF